jgi:hypothetical protein
MAVMQELDFGRIIGDGWFSDAPGCAVIQAQPASLIS